MYDGLLEDQRPSDRPDLIARVFKLKLNQLMREISIEQIFGIVVAKFFVVGFQKRGLPDAHIVLILDRSSKLRTTTDIDSVVSAEIPDKNVDL